VRYIYIYLLIFVIKSEELGIAHVAIQCVPAQKLWQRTEYDAVPARPNASIEDIQTLKKSFGSYGESYDSSN
jgi:16S rRNA G527 N7-methylase RsmG